jgi:acetyl/propionyl-CoA carboxylase alpha subunit
VREQILVASGEPLSVAQSDVSPRGHAIEVRIYAEDPSAGFLPSSGRLLDVELPSGPGIRVDAGVETGSVVTTDYDPMLAKLIAYGRTRNEALGRLRAALDECHVAGIASNVEFLRRVISEPDFRAGKATTDFLEIHELTGAAPATDRIAALAAAGALQELDGWRSKVQPRSVTFAGVQHPIEVSYDWKRVGWRARDADGAMLVSTRDEPSHFDARDGKSDTPVRAWRTHDGIELALGSPVQRRVFVLDRLEDVAHAGAHAGGSGGSGQATAPMSGTVVKIACETGAQVKARQVLAVIEAMKMEHAITAPFDGHVVSVNAKPGDRVDGGAVLVEIEPAA